MWHVSPGSSPNSLTRSSPSTPDQSLSLALRSRSSRKLGRMLYAMCQAGSPTTKSTLSFAKCAVLRWGLRKRASITRRGKPHSCRTSRSSTLHWMSWFCITFSMESRRKIFPPLHLLLSQPRARRRRHALETSLRPQKRNRQQQKLLKTCLICKTRSTQVRIGVSNPDSVTSVVSGEHMFNKCKDIIHAYVRSGRQDTISLPPGLSSEERRSLHALCESLFLEHFSQTVEFDRIFHFRARVSEIPLVLHFNALCLGRRGSLPLIHRTLEISLKQRW